SVGPDPLVLSPLLFLPSPALAGKSQQPGPRVCASASGLLFLLSLLFPWSSVSGQFSARAQVPSVAGLVGDVAKLSCLLTPPQSLANLEVRWFRGSYEFVVLLKEKGVDQPGPQLPQYRGRSHLLSGDNGDGVVTLQLKDLRPGDEGNYTCFFRSRDFYEQAVVELNVTGLGPAPLLQVAGHKAGGVLLVCSSEGWYPKPNLQWREQGGRVLPAQKELKPQENQGLFRVQSSLILMEEANYTVACHISIAQRNLSAESRIYLTGLFFPKFSYCLMSLAVLLAIFLSLILLVAFLFWKHWKSREAFSAKQQIYWKEKGK
uniref:Ig-like domain-containing protein n=1 Tax=Ornithorhynchus anatinus TaxID=9258 RepID=A0A6I8NBW2_ORNAN